MLSKLFFLFKRAGQSGPQFIALMSLAVLLSGCEGIVNGFVYSHIQKPLTENMHDTPLGSKHGKLDIKHLDLRIEANWDSNSFGDIAKGFGMQKMYYADIETLKILGIWEQNWVHLYGD